MLHLTKIVSQISITHYQPLEDHLMYIISNRAKNPLPESENMAIFVVDGKD